MNVLSSLILSTVEVANLLPLAAVVICVGAMIMFLAKAAVILRVQADDTLRPSAISTSPNVQVPRLKMTRVHIPFTFRLLETGNNSFEEIRLAVSSQVRYTLQAFWAVSIRELHSSCLWRTWSELREQTRLSVIVNSTHCQQLATNVRCQQPHSETVVTLKSPQQPPLLLGAPPRLAYPLVVFMIREAETDELLHPDETVILVNVVHLRDPVCPLPTSILAQYLKQASGQLSCLKQLYLATGDPTSDDAGSSQIPGSLSLAEPVACADSTGPLLCTDSILQDCPGIEQLCVVCHYFPLSRALLPCRHTCICAVCFGKLDRCPMCRAAITSYFCIRSEEYVPPNATESRANSKSKVAVHWLDALNDRLTDFLGFR